MREARGGRAPPGRIGQRIDLVCVYRPRRDRKELLERYPRGEGGGLEDDMSHRDVGDEE